MNLIDSNNGLNVDITNISGSNTGQKANQLVKKEVK